MCEKSFLPQTPRSPPITLAVTAFSIRFFSNVCIAFFFATFIICNLVIADEHKTILIINSYNPEFPWVASYNRGLKLVLNEGHYDIKSFYMDTKRKPTSEFIHVANEAWLKYQALRPVAVVLGDDNALRLIGPKLIDQPTQVVYLGINNNPRNYGMFGHPNTTGVLERPLIKRSMLLMNHLLPVKRALAIFDASVTSKIVRQEIFNGQDSVVLGDTIIDIYITNDIKDWKNKISDPDIKKRYSALFIGLYHTVVDPKSGNHVPADELLQWTSENTIIPMFAFWDFSIGSSMAIGGYVLFGEEQGKAAGDLVLEMLGKAKNYHINPITGDTGRFLFSRSELKRWQLKLPARIENQSTFVD